jgi:hypothetical protein
MRLGEHFCKKVPSNALQITRKILRTRQHDFSGGIQGAKPFQVKKALCVIIIFPQNYFYVIQPRFLLSFVNHEPM